MSSTPKVRICDDCGGVVSIHVMPGRHAVRSTPQGRVNCVGRAV